MKWLERELVRSPYRVALCRCPKAFQKEMKRLKVPAADRPTFLPRHADAAVHFLERDGGREVCAIVCLGSTKGRTKVEIIGLLVHEAVHIWQAVREHLGETSPSAEFEAYSVQGLAQRLLEAFEEKP